jgi:hypothetical protein
VENTPPMDCNAKKTNKQTNVIKDKTLYRRIRHKSFIPTPALWRLLKTTMYGLFTAVSNSGYVGPTG